jgi:multidrug transporter EmrE-like cation transporter
MYYLVLLSIVEIFGDFALEAYANHGVILGLFWGIIGYIGVVYFLIKSLAGSTVLYVNGMWDGISALLESIAAFIILGERLNSSKQYLGLFLIIIGLFFLKRDKETDK